MSVNLIKSAHGVIIMYDITSKQSFNSVYDWIKNVKNVKGENFPMILVGNKKDKEKERLIAKEEVLPVKFDYQGNEEAELKYGQSTKNTTEYIWWKYNEI